MPPVTHSQNVELLRPFEGEEVKSALFSMFPDKAPGADGMNPGFYQHFWDVVGDDVTTFVLKCLNECSFPECLNDTNVVLIPKKKSPEMVYDLRLIALCNVVYKIMAKMVANRMKPLLGDVISESQSAFIPNRLISDNILIAAKLGHYLNRKQTGMVGWAALKLDMAKAYDRMEWTFLRKMLVALGFSERWVQLQAQSRRDFHGCRVARGAPPVSHLFFADDSLPFFKATIHEAEVIRNSLNIYESMSGQAVNYHKSSVCFSRNTSEVCREDVASVLGVTQAPNFGKYLGLPSFIGRNRRAVFSYIEDKIKQRLGSWNKRLISQAGKEILLKSVAQSMPTFSMSVFLLPDGVCQSIERAMNRYWWSSGSERGIHWKAWDRLCIPKNYRGLGFKDLRAFNLAMLCKQAWRFLTRPDSLVTRIYKARYFPKTSFIDAKLGSCPSYCWRSIMGAHELICSGVRKRIGDGRSTLIWGHPWLPDGPNPMIQTNMPHELDGSLVSGLVDPDTGTWDHSILCDIFSPTDVERILKVPVSLDYEDSWFWVGDPGGTYTVKQGYRNTIGNFESSPGDFDKWSHLWKIKSPAKWKTFLWKALSNVLPTTTNLILKRVEVDPACPMCGLEHESIMHSLILCDFSRLVWHESSLHANSVNGNDFPMWFSNALCVLTDEQILVAAAVLYYVWRARNSAVWEGCLPRPKAVWRSVTTWRQTHLAAPHSPSTPVHLNVAPLPVAAAHTLPHANGLPPKCYFDASFNSAARKATVGAILVSSDGGFLATFNGHLPACFSPLMTESLACKEVLSWLKDRGLASVDVYTDCYNLKQLLCSNNVALYSYVAFSINATRALMSSFTHCSPPNLKYLPMEENESAIHMFAHCSEAQRVWSLVELPIPTGTAVQNISEWFFNVLTALNDDMLTKFVMVCWSLWSSRNERVWKGITFNVHVAIRRGLALLENWSSANANHCEAAAASHRTQWTKPAVGRIKLNTDVAVRAETNVMGLG
ncbi:uncharacterized protein LOC116012895 [Ipomoea triloba]|uniref:uncharacterized protein LOC116012895 n=1 Tax=Ipomoea triloba TaxID=35885 RepID=UPI00125E134A|nr:uncharacterized protein LOC116012895 [Ipomoea triloba]